MALPATLSSFAMSPGHNPAHKSAAGDYYAFVLASTTGGHLWRMVSPGTDPSGTWSALPTGFNVGSTACPCVSSVYDSVDDKIHIVQITQVSGALDLTYRRFDCSTETYDATGIQIADLSGMTAPDSSVLWCSIAYRSGATNELVVAASGLTDSYMGSSYQRVDLWHADQSVTTAGGWTGPVAIDASTDGYHEFQPVLSTGDGSHVHALWSKDLSGALTNLDRVSWRTFSTSNTLSTRYEINTSRTNLLGHTNAVSVLNGSSGTFLVHRVHSDASFVQSIAEDGSNNLVSTQTLEGSFNTDGYENGEVGVGSIAADSAGNVYAFYSGGGASGADQDLYFSSSSDYGDTWATEAEILDAVTVNYISAAVLDSGKIAYLYDDGGTTKYNEYSLSGDVDVSVGTKAFTLTTNQATVTNPTSDVNVAVNSVTFSLTPNQAAVVKDVEVTSGTASFTLTPQQAAVTLDTQLDANTVNFSLTPRTATVSNDVNVGVNSASFTLTTTPATVTNPNQDTNVVVGVVTFTHTENAATITYDVDVPVNTETFTFTPHQASIDYGVNVLCNSASFTFTEQQATVTYDVEVLVGTESLVLTTYPASLSEDTDVSVGTVSLSLNTFPSAISYDVNVDAQAASLSLTEQTASVIYDVDVPVGTETLSLTTHQATIQATSDVFVNVGTVSLSLTTNQAQVAADTAIDVGTVNFTLTPLSGSVSYSVNVESTSFSFALVENQATISLDRNVQVGTVSLSLTPQTATIVAESQDTNISCGTVSLSLTEQAATISNDVNVIVSSPVSLVLQEETATLALDRNVQVDVKPFVLTPAVATVSFDKEVSVGVATLTLNTIPANILSGTGRVAAKINGVEIPQIA